MLESITKGWNFFKNKNLILNIFLIIITLTYSLYFFKYIDNLILNINIEVFEKNILNMLFNIINIVGWNIIFIFLGLFVFQFLINFMIASISMNINQNNRILPKISKILKFSLIQKIVFLNLFLITALLLSYINIFTMFLLFIMIISLIPITFIFYMSIIILPNNYNIKDSLVKSWNLLKEKFWVIICFFILMYIFLFVLYVIIDYIYFLIFGYNLIISIIILAIYYTISVLYITNSLTIFINKYV